MVAGSDAHLCLHLAQGLCQLLTGLPKGAVSVQQVSRQQHQVDAVRIDVVGQTEGHLPALPPPGRRLLWSKRPEGAV